MKWAVKKTTPHTTYTRGTGRNLEQYDWMPVGLRQAWVSVGGHRKTHGKREETHEIISCITRLAVLGSLYNFTRSFRVIVFR